MSSICRLRSGVIAKLVVMLFGLAISAEAEPVPQVVQVVQVKGQARYSSDNKTWHAVKKGEVFQPGVMIQTGDKSAVDLQLGDEGAAPTLIDTPEGLIRTPEELKVNTIRLYEESVLYIGKLAEDRSGSGEVSETQLDLRAGRMMGGVRKTSAESRYEIKFPLGVAGVRSGVYHMNSSGKTDVLYGAATIAWQVADGSTQVKTVDANHQFDPHTGLVTELSAPLPIEPVVTDNSKSRAASASTPIPSIQGAGMGGSWRKF